MILEKIFGIKKPNERLGTLALEEFSDACSKYYERTGDARVFNKELLIAYRNHKVNPTFNSIKNYLENGNVFRK